jgi:hypothetical protein
MEGEEEEAKILWCVCGFLDFLIATSANLWRGGEKRTAKSAKALSSLRAALTYVM